MFLAIGSNISFFPNNFFFELLQDVVAKKNVEVDFLNQISFPRDYLWMHDSDTTIVTGQKVFKGILSESNFGL